MIRRQYHTCYNYSRLGGVLVNVLTPSLLKRPGSIPGYNKIGICCFSAKHASLKSKEDTGLLEVGIMCPSVMT